MLVLLIKARNFILSKFFIFVFIFVDIFLLDDIKIIGIFSINILLLFISIFVTIAQIEILGRFKNLT
jgi:hypothetical protein